MPPHRSIVPNPELCKRARSKPFRVPLAGPGKLNDLRRDKFGCLIFRTGRKLKPCAHSIKRLAHSFNVRGLESDTMGSGSWHRGAADVRVFAPDQPHATVSCRQMCDKHEELKSADAAS
jgi:hypothetical protein